DLGNGDADRFQSGSGNDVIITRSEQYDDQIATNAGADTVKVAGGNDVVDLGTGSDVLIVDYSHFDSGAGVTTGVQTGTLATGYGGYFDLANSSAHSVVFAGAERFDLTLTIRNDAVTTGDGDDVLDGRAGDDTLIGAGGNDTYVVGSQGDRVVETANGGTDTIKSSVTFALEAGQAIEILATTSDTAKTAINLTGNELVNRLRGNAGANVLDGGLGADLMYGLAGNDTYLVDDAADRVYEAAAGGTLDTVKVAANVLRYALLAGQEIESLAAADVAGFAALSLTGNEFGQAITGNAGDNVLKGGLGADALNGKGGVDTADYSDKTTSVAVTLNRNTSAVVTVGGQSEDTLVAIENVVGGSAADMLTGDDLANRLDGGRGADVLKGMAGADTYIVDDAGDQVIEAAAGGTDAVLASVSYTLQAGQEIEGLSTTDDAGLGAINLTGNEFVNALKGN
ncbi:calcium-binding protein, partial [Methylopila sp. Yamaguchi]|uniref:calcium-binding protein n=1 Tax=Methylopila sp. Yamaguchi TaxID=1437817 RepID=UPI0011AEE4C1